MAANRTPLGNLDVNAPRKKQKLETPRQDHATPTPTGEPESCQEDAIDENVAFHYIIDDDDNIEDEDLDSLETDLELLQDDDLFGTTVAAPFDDSMTSTLS